MLLQRRVGPGGTVHRVYETILMENRRLEHLVRDAAVPSELFQKEPIFQKVHSENVLKSDPERLAGVPEMKSARFKVCLDPQGSRVQGGCGGPGNHVLICAVLLGQALRHGLRSSHCPDRGKEEPLGMSCRSPCRVKARDARYRFRSEARNPKTISNDPKSK